MNPPDARSGSEGGRSSGAPRARPGLRAWLLPLSLVLAALLGAPPPARANLARYEQAVRQRPEDLRLRYLLGRKYAAAGEHRKAAAQFEAIQRTKKRIVPVVQFHLGLAYSRLGNLTKAVLAWTRLLEEKPNNTKTMGYLGLALYKQGLASPNEELRQQLFQESLDWWRRILRLDPANLRARYFAGIEYYKLGRYEDAAKQWLIFLRVKKNHPKVLGLVAKALTRLGRWDQAHRTLVHLDRVGQAKGNRKVRLFARQLLQQLEAAKAGGPRPDPELDEEEVSRDAVTRDPDEVRPLPPGPEPPPPPPLEPRPEAPGVPVDEPVTLQAETLFLDGLDYKEEGNLEKALFAFLQAIDIQPDFSQVYLQIGEVYLGLARLAPTPKEFEQRLRLSQNALQKVKDISPNTLLSHAAHGKLNVVKRSQRLGFHGYHEEIAKAAVAEGREADAFQEYVILLSNQDFRPTIFLQLATLLPRLTEGNQQDLRFFLEELRDNHPDHPLVAYLLGRVYLVGYRNAQRDPDRAPDPDLLRNVTAQLDAAIEGFGKNPEARNHLLGHTGTAHAAPVDHLVLAKVLAREQDGRAALEALETFLKAADREHPFHDEAGKLKEQILTSLRPAGSRAASVDVYAQEKEALLGTVGEAEIFFDQDEEGTSLLSPGHLVDVNRFQALKIFVDNHPSHGIGRFLLGWLLKKRADSPSASGSAEALRREANALWEEVHGSYLADAWYHFRLGRQVLRWTLVDPDLDPEAEHFFRTARWILLSQGSTHFAPLAGAALEEAARWRRRDHVVHARRMVDLARVYDPGNLQLYVELFHLEMAEGNFFGALWVLPVWLFDALSRYWVRQVLLSDLALLVFLTFLFGLLAWSVILVARYLAELDHLVREFWEEKGFLLPLSMVVNLGLVVAFPTGLVLFVPFLAWHSMRLKERVVYAVLLTGMLVTPALLPLSLTSNFALLRAYEQVASGRYEGVEDFLRRELSERTPDLSRLYLLAVASLRTSELDQAEAALNRVLELAPRHDGALVNLGVLQARRGNTEAALQTFKRAIEAEARNARALYDSSVLYGLAEDQEKRDQYHRWAVEIAPAAVRQRIDELDAIPEEVTRLPLLDQPLEPEQLAPYFRFYGGRNFLALNMPFFFFLTWFLLGGGLAGFLLFHRERMDIVLARCNHCQSVMCSLCQTVSAGRSYCPDCATPETRPGFMGSEASEALAARAVRRARILNMLLPGAGLAFLDWSVAATGFLTGIFFLFLLRFSRGGFVADAVFRTTTLGPIELFLTLGVCIALVLYFLAQYLLWRNRDQIQGK